MIIVFVSVVRFIWEEHLTENAVDSLCLFSCPRELKTSVLPLCSQAYEELFWRRHIKCVRQVKRDNYDALRSVLFQIFSQGLSFPSWMKEKDIVKVSAPPGETGNVTLMTPATRAAGLLWAALTLEGAWRGLCPVLCLSCQFADKPSQKESHPQFCLFLSSFLEKGVCPLEVR